MLGVDIMRSVPNGRRGAHASLNEDDANVLLPAATKRSRDRP